MDNAALKARARELMKPQFVTLLLLMIVEGVVLGLINLIPVAGSIICLVLSGPLLIGTAFIYTKVIHQETAKLEDVFEPFKTSFVNGLVANLLQFVIVLVFSLLLIVPGIMKAYSYAMTFYILRYEPTLDGMSALRRSEEIMKGHRMELFMLQLSFIGWILLCIVTCGIASLWVGPYMQTAEVLFFENLYQGKQA